MCQRHAMILNMRSGPSATKLDGLKKALCIRRKTPWTCLASITTLRALSSPNLTARRDEVNKTADMPSRRAYRRARANVEHGGQSYNAD